MICLIRDSKSDMITNQRDYLQITAITYKYISYSLNIAFDPKCILFDKNSFYESNVNMWKCVDASAYALMECVIDYTY